MGICSQYSTVYYEYKLMECVRNQKPLSVETSGPGVPRLLAQCFQKIFLKNMFWRFYYNFRATLDHIFRYVCSQTKVRSVGTL